MLYYKYIIIYRGDNMLNFKNVTKQFENVTAVKDVSFELSTGKVLGIVGRNGSRKINNI
ncbi:MAG: hypothetical protein IKK43_05865 [Clostridia bacterium]|nr:hypothetical protein [Clostridia bacterium]